MADIEPGPDNNYQVSPTLTFSRARWNAVMASIAARLKAREVLEASFEALIGQGTQAALDLIGQNVAPQLEDLADHIAALEAQLDEILGSGNAPNALKLGGQLPAFYLALANATGTLPAAKVTGIDTMIAAAVAALVNGSPAVLDTLKEISDALGGDANFAATMAAALANRLRFDAAQALSSAQQAQALANLGNRHVPAGSLISVIGTAAPAGFIKANGAALSRATYADLWTYAQSSGALVSQAAYDAGQWGCFSTGDGSTTFRVPDLRGVFGRGWDDGRGLDSGRLIGSYQDSDNRAHGHGVNDGGHNHSVNDPGHSHYMGDIYQAGNFNGQFGGGNGNGIGPSRYNNGALTGIWLSASGANISIQNSGGVEARPRNVSFLYCIKY